MVLQKSIYDILFSRLTEKEFQRQLTVPPHEQTLMHNTDMEEKHFAFFLTQFIQKIVLFNQLCLRRNILFVNVLIIDNFIKRYQTAFIVDFFMRKNAFRFNLQ